MPTPKLPSIFTEKFPGESETEVIDDSNTSRRRKKKQMKTVYEQGSVFPELLGNSEGTTRTLRIDSKMLAEAESEDPNKNRSQAAEDLRQIVATIGKRGHPGEQIRCVVSVAMLNEGWDANNVTHILGLRAFTSQLLCEQVVGRGLRRMNYTPDPETGLAHRGIRRCLRHPVFGDSLQRQSQRCAGPLMTNRKTTSAPSQNVNILKSDFQL